MSYVTRWLRAAIALAVLGALGWLGGCSDEPTGPGSGVASVTVTPNSVTLVVGATTLLSATVRDASGTELKGRPVTWRSGNAAVAPVDANGMVTALSAGPAAVIATSEGVSDTAAITVTDPTVASVTVVPAWATLSVGATRQLYATLRDPNGTALPGRPVTWATDKAAVAMVSTGGLVTGVGAGSAALIATSEGVSDTAAITVIDDRTAFLSVNAGQESTCGLKGSGVAYCWGRNQNGQLGDGSTTASPVPVAVTGGLTFSEVTTSHTHTLSCGLTTSGAPYCWGAWANGFTSFNSSSIPVAVPGSHEFAAVTVGGSDGPPHACGLTTTGAVFCWGQNFYGQLGGGTTGGPEDCSGWGCRSVPVAVVGGLTFIEVSAGGDHTCGLTTSGAAYCWGRNGNGQLGNGSTIISSVPVAVSGGLTFSTVSAGGDYTCGLTTSGVAYCWGFDGAGQLGDGSIMSQSVPVAVSGGLTFSAISAGGNNTCGVTTSGAAYCWGEGWLGHLGTGEARGPDQCEHALSPCSRTPVAVAGGLTFARLSTAGGHSCGITVGSIAYCWGENAYGQLGDGTKPETWRSPAPVLGGLSFSALAAGFAHTCGLTSSGAAYCWGDNLYSQLGDGSTTGRSTPVAVSGGLSFSAFTTGGLHTCGPTSSGAAYCWGSNLSGQLGDGSTTDRSTPVAVFGGVSFSALAIGYSHTCGLTNSGAAYCWGSNLSGQLGDGSTTGRSTPVAVSGGVSFSVVSAGGFHTCGLTSSGAAYCWGENSSGQLGNGYTIDSPTPVMVSGGLSFSAFTTGGLHTCGLTSSGAAYCWGRNDYGQLGDGSTTARSTPGAVSGGVSFSALTAGGFYTCGLTSSGAAYCWGRNDYGQLGDGSITDRSTPVAVSGGVSFSAIAAGNRHACGLTSSGAASCWGYNILGQLGRGTLGYSPIPVAVAPF